LGQLGGGGCDGGVQDDLVVEIGELINLALGSEDLKTYKLIINGLLKLLSHLLRVDYLCETVCLSSDQVFEKAVIEITLFLQKLVLLLLSLKIASTSIELDVLSDLLKKLEDLVSSLHAHVSKEDRLD
jgi:hypothetical protein